MGKEPYDEEAEKDKVISCDEVSSSDDVFENANSFENFDMLDNFNPSLFCPDIILELEDTPIIINDGNLYFLFKSSTLDTYKHSKYLPFK